MRLFLLLALALPLSAQTANYTYDALGRLTSVTYPNGKLLTYSYDPAGNLRQRVVTTIGSGAAPASSAAGVAHAASATGGPVAPGELVTIYGSNLGPANLVQGVLTSFGFFDSALADTEVLFDGIAAPIIYAYTGQTTAIVPYAVAGKSSTQMVIRYQGKASAPVTVPVAAASPGLFSANQSGSGNGAILNEDFGINGPSNPAAKGSVVVLYGTGEGQTNPPGIDGKPAAGVYPKPLLPFSVTIGGIDSEVLYYGAAPGLVAGVFQANVRVPAGVPSGDVAVVVKVGTFSSRAGLTVAVK